MSRDISKPPAPRGPFPRPILSLRELLGLVLAFAVSNTLLSWLIRAARWPVGIPFGADELVFAYWNLVLCFYLGFAFVQGWLRSVIRWLRTGDARPPGRFQPRWTALGVAEGTVIGGTILFWLITSAEKALTVGLDGGDWELLVLPLLFTAATAIAAVRLWRGDHRSGATGTTRAGTTSGGHPDP